MRLSNVSTACALATALLLAGCGGGVEVGIEVPPPDRGPDFDVIALINGQRLSGVDVFPGETQTISIVAGDSFELDTDGPVYWDLSAGGSAAVPAAAGTTFVYQGAALNETSVGRTLLVLASSSNAAPGSTIPITITVTSRDDTSQYATIQLLVTD
ncbi:MAG: hypothetical protein ACJ8GJ_00990 [Vitreoscilla sp.]